MVGSARPARFKIAADTDHASSIVRELGDLLGSGKLAPKIVEHLAEIRKPPHELFRIEAGSAVGTVIRVLLEPTDRLIDLLAAARTFKVE